MIEQILLGLSFIVGVVYLVSRYLFTRRIVRSVLKD